MIPLIDERTLANRDAAESFPVVAAWNLQPSAVATTASADDPIVLVGSGDGLVDVAGARLLDPERPVLYAATLDDLTETGDFDPAMVGPDTWWVVTDSNRKQARHWSTVSSNLGALEADGPLTLDDDPANQQLDVFLRPLDDVDRQTHAVHDADVSDIRASYYGNKIAFTTGDAPAFAFDGDPTTAWRAGAFSPTGGLVWEVDFSEPVTSSTINVLQPITDTTGRFIIDARITLDAGLASETAFDVRLDERSRALPGQLIDLPVDSFESLRIEVINDNVGKVADYSILSGIGLAEVSIDGVRDDRIVRVPGLDAFDIVDPDELPDQRITYVFTRQRIDPATANESPAEPTLVREFTVPDARPFALSGEARVSARATEETLADLLDDPYDVIADRRLRGSPGSRGAAAFDGDPTTAWQTPFDTVAGATLTVAHPAPIEGGTLTMSWLDDERHSVPTEIVITGDDGTAVTVPVPATEPVDGIATVDLPLEGYRATTSTITFSGVAERTTPEYFSGLPMILPLGISEISFGDGTSTQDPGAALDEQCRTDLLTIDDVPIAVRIAGTKGQAAARSELTLSQCGEPIDLDTGRHVLRTMPGASSGFDIDRVVLDGSVTERRTAAAPDVAIDSTEDARVDAHGGAVDVTGLARAPAELERRMDGIERRHRPRDTHPHQWLRQWLAAASIGAPAFDHPGVGSTTHHEPCAVVLVARRHRRDRATDLDVSGPAGTLDRRPPGDR